LKLQPYKPTVMHPAATWSRVDFVSNQAWLYLNVHVNKQSWNTDSAYFIHKIIPLHDVKVGVWCVHIVRRVPGPMCCAETINS
jgi:hypothetical protein